MDLEAKLKKAKSLKDKITNLKSSSDFRSPNEIEELQKSIEKARLVQEKISKAEEDSGFCSGAEIDRLQKRFDSVQKGIVTCKKFL